MATPNNAGFVGNVAVTVQGAAYSGAGLLPGPQTVALADVNYLTAFPGAIVQNAGYPGGPALVGLNGGRDFVRLTDGWRLAAGTPTALTGAQLTNTFNVSNSSGSVLQIQSFIATSTLQDTPSMVRDWQMPSSYVGNGANFTINCLVQNTGGGSLNAPTLTAKCWQMTGQGNTLGPMMSNAGAGQVGTAVAWPTSTGTLSFACVPGTAAPVLSSGSQIAIEIDATYLNVSGSNSIIINAIWLS